MAVVWIIDSEQWPRVFLRAELIERGFDAAGYLSADDALQTLRWRFPDLIVIELRDLPRDAAARLFQIGVPIIGIASRPEPEWIADFSWSALLHRPISIGEIADRVRELTPRK